MSFNITSDEKGLVPILVCTQCEKPIQNLSLGTVMWLPSDAQTPCGSDASNGEQVAAILHKGECSRQFDAVHKVVGNYLHCMELTQFFEAWFQGAQFLSYDRKVAQRNLGFIRDLGNL